MATSFIKTFNSISTEIDFNPAWANGTGYYDHAIAGVHMPIIPTGMSVKCTDNIGRKMIITSITGKAEDGEMNGKQISCVIIFERYPPADERPGVVANASAAMRSKFTFLKAGYITDENFSKFHLR